jgi:hypothetical protein
MYGIEIQKLVAKAKILKNYDDKIALIKQAVSIADSKNDIEWGIELRQMITGFEYYTPHFNETYLIINWFVGMQSHEPDLIDNEDFLWNYKHAIGEVLYNPTISKDTKEGIEQDYLARMNDAGFSKRPFYDIYFRYYTFLQNKEKANEFKALRNAEIHDSMSNCEACELDNDVEFALLSNQIEEAKDLAIPLLTNKKTCTRVPLVTNVNFTKYYSQNGDLDTATSYYTATMEELESKNDQLAYLKYGLSLLDYLVDSNQVDVAIKNIEAAFVSLKNASDELHFLANRNIVNCFSKIKQESITIHFPDWFEKLQPNHTYLLNDLILHFNQKIHLFIHQIDERNQNDDFKNVFLM